MKRTILFGIIIIALFLVSCTQVAVEEKTDLQKSLGDTQNSINEYQEKTDKLNECTKVCAGEDYDIPYIKSEWYNVCSQLYYYAGMEALDEQIADCKQ